MDGLPTYRGLVEHGNRYPLCIASFVPVGGETSRAHMHRVQELGPPVTSGILRLRFYTQAQVY